MGMYDTFIGTVNCKKCNKEFEFEEQTKNYECLLSTFELGDYIDKGNSNYIYTLYYNCPHCNEKHTISIVIKKGQIVGIFNKLIDDNLFDSLENIEDGYAKNQRYLKMCENMIGYDINPAYKIPKEIKKNDIITALNQEWIIDDIYKEVLKDKNEIDEKLYNFFKLRFADNFICKCHNKENNVQRILVLKNNYGIALKEPILDQKEEWNKEDYKQRYITQNHCNLIHL